MDSVQEWSIPGASTTKSTICGSFGRFAVVGPAQQSGNARVTFSSWTPRMGAPRITRWLEKSRSGSDGQRGDLAIAGTLP